MQSSRRVSRADPPPCWALLPPAGHACVTATRAKAAAAARTGSGLAGRKRAELPGRLRSCFARPAASRRPGHDPADRPGNPAPARRLTAPALAARPRRALAGLATPPPGSLPLAPPASAPHSRCRDHPGQLAIGCCRTRALGRCRRAGRDKSHDEPHRLGRLSLSLFECDSDSRSLVLSAPGEVGHRSRLRTRGFQEAARVVAHSTHRFGACLGCFRRESDLANQ